MGFVQQLLQNNPQLQQLLAGRGEPQPNLPQQGQQSRFGQQGLMESMRSMQPPSRNLPQQGGFQGQGSMLNQHMNQTGQGLGASIQDLIASMRERLGQQGLGSGMQGGLGQQFTPMVNPKMPTTGTRWTPQQQPQQPRLPYAGGPGMPTGGGGPIGAPAPPFGPPAPPSGTPFNGGITERMGPGGLVPNAPTGQAAPSGSTITERAGPGGLVPGPTQTPGYTGIRPPKVQSRYGNLGGTPAR